MTDTVPELHCHLDGSLRRATLRALAAAQGVDADTEVRFTPGMGLSAALACFTATLSVLQTEDAVARVAAELCEDAARVGISPLEIRFAPQLHAGAPVEAIVDAAADGVAGQAGLILCGLYGEDPAVLDHLVEVAASRRAVVSIDLAGGPAPHHAIRLADYAGPFTRARALGLGRTVHASEGRPPGEIAVAIDVLHAQRVGHATTLLDDDGVVERALQHGVVVEACPTSNVHTGIFGSVAEHPLPRWLARGVLVTVCADNTLLSAVDAREELHRAMAIPGMIPAHRARLVDTGRRAAFPRR